MQMISMKSTMIMISEMLISLVFLNLIDANLSVMSISNLSEHSELNN